MNWIILTAFWMVIARAWVESGPVLPYVFGTLWAVTMGICAILQCPSVFFVIEVLLGVSLITAINIRRPRQI
ncbi:hypothetical protein JXA40_11570 [bacterium]|nr:hypothetical protein [candidate division CSSED10-310 bacterium]